MCQFFSACYNVIPMKVYFSTSASSIDKNIDDCRIIVDTIKKLGHELTRDWIEQAFKLRMKDHRYTENESKKIYQDNLQALKESDIIILEATTHTFNTGYLASLAINLQKPLLILTRDSAQMTSFLMGETTTLKYVESYSDKSEISSIVSSFLNENSNNAINVRFNMYIGRNISNFLKRESNNKGKSKAQVVREILEEYIANKT